ncbi:phosphatidate cytidylyltransferase [Rhodovulum bhavnagarense]|uniref:Phosphatidate cytidylyltransferase n=1 Tax=Rhodovulum bhavnagarense TaxID=992286 RepID=A0A4R2RI03_9RHOB|nr:phosphatidate cytidylyltransferase [Rhodovulum bhavnagarense]TCP63392.1 phosphatidate cytidylyltransferase [Rhodovulum bhavnagarense]
MAGNWEDLGPRLASGAGMAALGIAMVWLGGPWFAALAALVSGLMVWELVRMTAPAQRKTALQLGILAGAAVLSARALPGLVALPLLMVPVVAGAVQLRQNRVLFGVFAAAILAAGFGLSLFRDTYGMVWLIWLVLVVIATDVAGYFAGRFIGGPKFWPRVSPKKTWSGTLGGWFAAMLIGLVFLSFTNAGPDLPWISMALSLASQMGDIAESALKRRMGVKDSSSLIPGHGGLFDRFDGLLGAALFMLLVAQLVYVPEVRF